MALFLREQDVADLLTMREALTAVEKAFREQGQGRAPNQPRRRVRLPQGVLHVMAGAVPALGGIGLKAYTTFRGGARFVVLLFDSQDGRLLAVIEANRLGQLRTGAASGVATRFMARLDARVLGLLGAGYQAETQVEAICAVRPIHRVQVYSRTPEHRARFARTLSDRLGIAVVPVESARQAVEGADIIVTATTASQPVLLGEWLTPGVHVNAIGSNAAIRRELDEQAVARADRIAVDDLEQARLESGDLIYAVERGLIGWERVCPLGAIVANIVPGRLSRTEITLFESQGIALEDVAVAMRVYQLAREQGRGEEIAFLG